MVLNLAVWFAIHTIFRSVQPVAAGAILAMFRFKVGIFTTLGAAAAIGVALHLARVFL